MESIIHTKTFAQPPVNRREILRYMNDPKSYPVEQAELPLIRSIDEAVDKAKMDNEWRHAFMIYQIHQQDAELRGEARGISIGEKRGISIGEERKAIDTAKSMMRESLPDDMISRVTGLAVGEVKKLRVSFAADQAKNA